MLSGAEGKMKRKLLISLLSSLAIVVGAVSVAYAVGTFKANQEGVRSAGEGQAARLTIQVEAAMADASSDLVPDSPLCGTGCTPPGGALSFSITNSSGVPVRVTQIALATYQCGFGGTCNQITSNKSGDGTFVPLDANGVPTSGTGDCSRSVNFVAPANFNNWPTVGPHTTLQVNGTDNNRLGAGMIHLVPNTPQGCQGATFAIGLNVTATEFTGVQGPPNP
jgi:hypothetical protein